MKVFKKLRAVYNRGLFSLIVMITTLVAIMLSFLTFSPVLGLKNSSVAYASTNTDGETLYLKDLIISYGDGTGNRPTEESAKWITHYTNYTLFGYRFDDLGGYNLNELPRKSATSFYDYVKIGFITTTNKDEALTNVSLMNMNGGFTRMKYEVGGTTTEDNINELTSEFLVMTQEFKTNYDKFVPTTDIAFDMLGMMYVPNTYMPMDTDPDYLDDWSYLNGDKRNMRLNYYICENITLTNDNVKELILKASSKVVSSVYNALATGLAVRYNPVTGKTASWVDLLSNNGPETSSNAESLYDIKAKSILDVVNSFSDDIKGAISRNTDVEVSDEQKSSDAVALSCYDILKSKKYGNGTLADLFVKDTIVSSDLYALVKVLSDAQLYAIKTTGMKTMLLNSIHNNNSIQEAQDEIAELDHSNPLSVWAGVNTDIYGTDVGLTTKAYRNAALGNEFSALERDEKTDASFKGVMEQIEKWSQAITAVAAAGAGVVGVGALLIAQFATTLTAETMTTLSTIICGSQMVAQYAGYVGLAFMAIIALVEVGYDIYEWYEKSHPEYTSIPEQMYDLVRTEDGTDAYVKYNAVRTVTSNKPGDLNAWQGKQ